MTSRFSGLVSQSGYAAHRWGYVESRRPANYRPAYSPEVRQKALQMRSEGKTNRYIGKILGISPQTVTKWAKVQEN